MLSVRHTELPVGQIATEFMELEDEQLESLREKTLILQAAAKTIYDTTDTLLDDYVEHARFRQPKYYAKETNKFFNDKETQEKLKGMLHSEKYDNIFMIEQPVNIVTANAVPNTFSPGDLS